MFLVWRAYGEVHCWLRERAPGGASDLFGFAFSSDHRSGKRLVLDGISLAVEKHGPNRVSPSMHDPMSL